ncbi:hypothetical protein OF83DRAFT_1169620 [Amylostereum chailletii]|nr:hypothetical protein OF83DRAFT_1169620 [Amylostereum chailletii]
MSDKQKATVSLTLVEQTCSAAFTALKHPSPPSPPLPLQSLHTDLLALLALISSDSTKITLALNPSDPSFKAALPSLRDLASRVSTLASNASSFDPSVHGRTLTSEVHTLAKDLLVAIQELSRAHLAEIASAKKTKSKGKGKGEEYMIKTATVHELVDRARGTGPDSLSPSNRAAVLKIWVEQGEIMADAISELEEDDGSGSEVEDDDDEWEDPEFDFGGGKATSPAQKEIKKQIHTLVSRVSSVFEQIGTSLLSSPTHTPSITLLDTLLDAASPLINAVDDFVACIYDGPESLVARRAGVITALQTICSAVEVYGEALVREDAKSSLDGSHEGSREWFVEQFSSLVDSVHAVEWPDATNTK